MPLRLFVALALPEELTDQLSAIAMGIPGARCQCMKGITADF